MITVPVCCRYCQSESIYRHGHARSGEPRYRCQGCQRSFQRYYHNIGNREDIPEKIVEMALNGSGVRDTSRMSGVSITTVVAHLKKLKSTQVNPLPIQALAEHHQVALVCEMDEQ